jgi:hypothetical protein
MIMLLFVGTHSREIEGQLIRTLTDNGWILEIERPAIISVGRILQTVVDGVQFWRNPKLIPDERVGNVPMRDTSGFLTLSKSLPPVVKSGEQFTINTVINNSSESSWMTFGDFPCFLSYHWLNTDGSTYQHNGLRRHWPVKRLNLARLAMRRSMSSRLKPKGNTNSF